jgi:hypothetical protein
MYNDTNTSESKFESESDSSELLEPSSELVVSTHISFPCEQRDADDEVTC